jgi:hypothetical protein
MELLSSPLSSLVSPLGGVAETLDPSGDVVEPGIMLPAGQLLMGGAMVVAEILHGTRKKNLK